MEVGYVEVWVKVEAEVDYWRALGVMIERCDAIWWTPSSVGLSFQGHGVS
jgi:hypothetical protein